MKLITALIFLTFSLSLHGGEIEETILSTGTGSVALKASSVMIRVAIVVKAKKAADVQRDLAKRNQRLIDTLKKETVHSLSTENYKIRTVNTSKVGGQEKTFEGRVNIKFQVPTAKAGKMIDLSLSSGANNIQNIEYLADPKEMETAHRKALNLASQDALKKGKGILKSLGLTYKGIHSITVNPSHGRPQAMSLRSSREMGTHIEAGDIHVNGSVAMHLRFQN